MPSNTDDEAAAQPAAVALISHAYWQRTFLRRRDVLGEAIVLDGTAHQIVGIAAQGFAFTDVETDVYTPLVLERPEGNNLSISNVLARLAPGATPAQVAGDATVVARTTIRPMVAEVISSCSRPRSSRASCPRAMQPR